MAMAAPTITPTTTPTATATPSGTGIPGIKMPSNPTPLSAPQEQQVRDIYYKNVRAKCDDEIKGTSPPPPPPLLC
ncbi:hypothetical protein BDV95DRAFT_561760 [Massariosphaeria phaeospora]|uniref:Uncharacterized protein n=1 Tax=Massariosphaeria phaeospora TaxID=100035 RepID=A0A7C8MF45_9PLEO|nr:hypothetical protein BDV95DRAFT_561760 [Massariosphaeria phaeospora]